MYTAALLIILVVFLMWVLSVMYRPPMATCAYMMPPMPPAPTCHPAGLVSMDAGLGRPLADVPSGFVASNPPMSVVEPSVNLGIGLDRGTVITNVDPGITEDDNLCPPDEPMPCPSNLQWQNTLPGCGSFHIPAKQNLGRSYLTDSRVWQGDLNPLIQERAALMAKEWDPYEHQKARQAWMQFLSTNSSAISDRYMKPISSVADAGKTLGMYGASGNAGVPGWCAMDEVSPS